MQFAGEAGVFDLETAVLNDVESGVDRLASCLVVPQTELKPDCGSSDRNRFVDDGRQCFPVAEDVHDVGHLGQVGQRRITPHAEHLGVGMSADAHHITAPAPGGPGPARAMELALRDAKLNPEQVDYINAHGTSTALNDVAETQAVKSVFGEHAYKLAMSSSKSMVGHLLGGAGGVEAVFTALTIRDSVVHPTINQETPDPACTLDYVPNEARRADVAYAMNNSFGFGGQNIVTIFKRYEG